MKAFDLIWKTGLLIVALSFFSNLYSQNYTISIENGNEINSNKFEFNVYIISNSGEFVLGAYQAALSFNQQIINDGQLTFEYISGSSDLKNVPSFGIGMFATDGTNELTFASNPAGDDTIYNIKKCIGKFLVTNSKHFGEYKPEVKWNFDGYINTIIIESIATDITKLATHVDLNYNNSLTSTEDKTQKPASFKLYQNYPNPFNPSTKVSYYIPTESNINFQIYTLTGERVYEMNNEQQNAGLHEFVWNGENLASGIYILAMNANPINGSENYSSVKKMTLLK